MRKKASYIYAKRDIVVTNLIRVLYIIHSSAKHQGSNISLLRMLDGLGEKGVVPFVMMPRPGDFCHELELRKIPFVVVPYYMAVHPHVYNGRDAALYIARLARILYTNQKATGRVVYYVRKFKPDIIHSNVGPIHVGHKAARRMGIPHVWHIREYQGLGFNMKPLFSLKGFMRMLHMSNNYPIAISSGIFDHFSMQCTARVIYNGIMPASCAQFIPHKENYFLFVGQLSENKGIATLLTAFRTFVGKDSRYRLYVVGDTQNRTYKDYLLSFVAESGIAEHVRFLGVRDDVKELMARATALIVPSLYEGFGRVTAEAMFNGCLVIGNNTRGTKEIIENGRFGIPYSCHEELVSAMRSVVANGIESYYPKIMMAQEHAITLYSQEQNVTEVFEYYREILSRYNTMLS